MPSRLRDLPYGEVLRISLPLVLASAGHAIRLFTDRVMLSWHSADALRASMPGGLTSFMAMTFFFGLAGYSATLAAHCHGAGEPRRIGSCIWQGLWVALAGGLFMAALAPWGPQLFAACGHEPSLAGTEGAYFGVLASGGVWTLLAATLSGYWSSRGQTSLVMAVSLGQTALNVVLNWLLIFGNGGLPELGVVGSALGTVISEAAGAVLWIGLFLARRERESHGTWPRRTFDGANMRRLLRFGAPQGLHFLLDIGAFNAFVLLMAAYPDPRVGEASTIAFSINAVAFIPMIGVGRGAAVLVGQAMGALDPPRAARAVAAAAVVATTYMAVLGALFLLLPATVLGLFTRGGDVGQAAVLASAGVLLWFVAAWMLFDGLWIILISSLQAAGDTRFCMYMGVGLAWTCLVIPSWLAWRLGASHLVLWSILVGYIVIGALVFLWRFRHGAWRSMRVLG